MPQTLPICHASQAASLVQAAAAAVTAAHAATDPSQNRSADMVADATAAERAVAAASQVSRSKLPSFALLP